MFKRKILEKYDSAIKSLRYETDKIDNKVNLIAGAFLTLEVIKVGVLIKIARSL